MTKECYTCHKVLPIESFGIRRINKDGRRHECFSCTRNRDNAFHRKHRERRLEYNRTHRRLTAEENRKKANAWYHANRDRALAAQREYVKANRKFINEAKRLRYHTDPAYRVTVNLRSRVRGAIKGSMKSAPTLQLIGADLKTIRAHLESKFLPGMTWENHGMYGWHIDHIRPCDSFDLSDPEQQRQCFHYTNLQPLWAADNIRKHAKWAA